MCGIEAVVEIEKTSPVDILLQSYDMESVQ